MDGTRVNLNTAGVIQNNLTGYVMEQGFKLARQAKALTKSERSRLGQRAQIKRQRKAIEALIQEFGQRKLDGGREVIVPGESLALQEAFRLTGNTRRDPVSGQAKFKPVLPIVRSAQDDTHESVVKTRRTA